MPGSQKQKKGKTKGKAPECPPPPPPPQEPAALKLLLWVPPLSSVTAQVVSPAVAPVVSGPTAEPGPPPPDELDIYVPRPHIPSPRQEMVDQFWESHETEIQAEKEDSGSELLPNKATSLPQNVKAPALQAGKRKASTHTSDRTGSVNPDSDDSNSDLSIQVVSKKAWRTPKETELLEVEETDEDLDNEVVTKGKWSKKLSRKEQSGDSDDEKDSYKNST